MADISAIRVAIRDALGAVQHHSIPEEFLRASDLELDAINPPVALVGVNDFNWDDNETGMDLLHFKVVLLASRADVKAGQAALDAYLQTSGPTSVKAVLENDRTLGGLVDRVRIDRVENYGFLEIAGITYLGAELIVDVRSSPN